MLKTLQHHLYSYSRNLKNVYHIVKFKKPLSFTLVIEYAVMKIEEFNYNSLTALQFWIKYTLNASKFENIVNKLFVAM